MFKNKHIKLIFGGNQRLVTKEGRNRYFRGGKNPKLRYRNGETLGDFGNRK